MFVLRHLSPSAGVALALSVAGLSGDDRRVLLALPGDEELHADWRSGLTAGDVVVYWRAAPVKTPTHTTLSMHLFQPKVHPYLDTDAPSAFVVVLDEHGQPLSHNTLYIWDTGASAAPDVSLSAHTA